MPLKAYMYGLMWENCKNFYFLFNYAKIKVLIMQKLKYFSPLKPRVY